MKWHIVVRVLAAALAAAAAALLEGLHPGALTGPAQEAAGVLALAFRP